MKVHHLNCCTMCPIFGRALVHPSGRMVGHCLLVETPDGLALIDTGIGLDDVASPRARLGRGFLGFARPRLDPEETAARQVERLGFKRSDVRHILCTHLDVDHAGGLPDFPDATVHIHEPEHAAATRRPTRLERERYRTAHLAHGPRWRRYDSARAEPWFGFQAVAPAGLPPEILIIPLPGHTRGHAGIAVDRGARGWLLHCGDAYFSARELVPGGGCPPGLRLFQRVAEVDRRLRLANQRRLRELAGGREVELVCAHDPDELAHQLR